MLRQCAFSIEQMAPGGIERAEPGVVRAPDIARSISRLTELITRPGGQRDPSKKSAIQLVLERTKKLERILADEGTAGIVYLDDPEFALAPRIRSAAIEIDFCFGDKNGSVSPEDIREARRHYGQVRGPVGWNRLLLTDEIERRLYPERTLRSTEGLRLLPEDWLAGPPDPLARLKKVSRYLDDSALARTYADIAARLATVASRDPNSDLSEVFEGALVLLGREIRERNSVRPTITDIARIGCEDPEVKECLKTPIEMSRRLQPSSLIDRYLLN
ncbi:hypothetical protein L6R52_19555 [Myxococcota bacterium]|nr:hypothetical protein [Myxococcota bacterium]